MNTANDEAPTSAAPETFIVAKTEAGFRVCSPLTPATQYVVSGMPDKPSCTCQEFDHHRFDPNWRCKHILAALQCQPRQNHKEGGETAGQAASNPAGPKPNAPAEAKQPPGRRENGAQMLIKRSVSPDGRIDSLSVEFSCPVGKTTAEEIKQKAEKTLKLQAEIVEGFRTSNGNGGAPATAANAIPGNGTPVNNAPGNGAPTGTNGTVSAQMLNVGGMNGKWGRRLFINVLVNGQAQSKLFGNQKELAEAVSAAGFPMGAERIFEGTPLNVPCRVTTARSPDGRYVNVERVFPAQAGAAKGG